MTREEAIQFLNECRERAQKNAEDFEREFPQYQSAWRKGVEVYGMAISALRQQEPNDWICTLKCTALMDEGMCSHGGLCCLYESQRTIKENQPLTLEELRQMDGEPVWVQSPGVPEYGRWAIVEGVGENCLFLHDDFTCHDYGKTWLAYRQKPEEVQK